MTRSQPWNGTHWVPLAALLLLVGCGSMAGTGAGATTTVAPTRPAGTPVVTTPSTPATTPVIPATSAATRPSTPTAGGASMKENPAAQAAIADLARQRGVDAGRIQVASVEAVEWSDSSLGCPQPGRAYAQVITPGWRIRLTLDGQPVLYHADRNNRVVLCASPSQ